VIFTFRCINTLYLSFKKFK